MNNLVESSSQVQVGNGQTSRDSRAGSANLCKRADSSGPLEALRRDSDQVRERQIVVADGPKRASGTSGESPWHRRIAKRAVLLVLIVLAVAAGSSLAWKYLQSYESTDDAQIDGPALPDPARLRGNWCRA
jgi:hypothetical protein